MSFFSPQKDQCLNISSRYDCRRTETPKIVDGRFLLESAWDVRCKDGGRINWRELSWTWSSIGGEHFYRLVGDPFLPLQRFGGRGRILDYDRYDFSPSNTEVESFSCSTCRVDFQFQFRFSRWVIRTWRDLGTETEPFHRWLRNGDLGLRGTHAERRTETYRPGPIEVLYNR